MPGGSKDEADETIGICRECWLFVVDLFQALCLARFLNLQTNA